MAKTLVDFRAEKGLYLKDVAAETGISEEELKAVEESGTVPPHIAQKLIDIYYLPDTYFAELVISSKVQPKSPMKYFFGVSLVWGIMVSIVATFPTVVSMAITTFSMLASNITDGVMNEVDVLANTPFQIFNSYFPTVINILSGIFLAKFLLKRTNYTGDIKKYQFLYPILPDATLLFLSMITGLVYEKLMAKILDGSLDASSPDYFLLSMSSEIISIISSVILILMSAFACAKLLNAAIMDDEAKKSKFLRTLAIIITVSTVICAVIYVIRSVTAEDFHLVQMIQNIIGYILTVVLAWLVALVKTENKKIEIVVYTVLPILAMIF